MPDFGVGENCNGGKCGGVDTKTGFPLRLQEGLLAKQMRLTEGVGKGERMGPPGHTRERCAWPNGAASVYFSFDLQS